LKIRNTGYPQAYGVGAPAAAEAPARDEKLKRAAAATAPRSVDEASILGIPAAELTPKVRAAIDRLLNEVQNLRGELDQARRRIDHLEQLADQDPLAPVLNRRAFVREMSRLMAFAERYGATSAVLYFDVNGLKEINDSLGHAAGDVAIAHVAEVLLAHVRGSDVVGRLGGDEFGVILAQSDLAGAQDKAQSLADAIAASPALWDGKVLPVGVAFGAHSLTAGQGALDALDAADRAMYEQKRKRSGG
jgi:diguanylate cyclase (GGDEF)-like protein